MLLVLFLPSLSSSISMVPKAYDTYAYAHIFATSEVGTDDTDLNMGSIDALRRIIKPTLAFDEEMLTLLIFVIACPLVTRESY